MRTNMNRCTPLQKITEKFMKTVTSATEEKPESPYRFLHAAMWSTDKAAANFIQATLQLDTTHSYRCREARTDPELATLALAMTRTKWISIRTTAGREVEFNASSTEGPSRPAGCLLQGTVQDST